MKGQLRINEMFAFIVVDDDGTEGIPAYHNADTGMIYPLVGADMARAKSLMPLVIDISVSMGRTVTLVKFTNRIELEHIEGGNNGREEKTN